MKPTHQLPRCPIGECDQDRLPGVPVCLRHGVGIWMSMQDVVTERLGQSHGDRLLTRQQIRTMIPSLKPVTLRAWIDRGQLTAAQTTPAGTALYWLSHVEANMHKANGRLPRHKESHDPIVYYAQLPGEMVKIGVTTNLKRRLVELRLGADSVMATEPGDQSLEAQRHRQFAADRVGRREDFRQSPDLMAHIERIAGRHVA